MLDLFLPLHIFGVLAEKSSRSPGLNMLTVEEELNDLFSCVDERERKRKVDSRFGFNEDGILIGNVEECVVHSRVGW